MNKITQQSQKESVRLDYLNAMGVIPWVLREPFAKNDPSINQHDDQSHTDNEDKTVVSQSIEETILVNNGNVDTDLRTNRHFYLKFIRWESKTLLEPLINIRLNQQNVTFNEKTLLIVCRHKIDQPANSFANHQSPSRFMLDYLRSIIELGLQNNIKIDIKLAHLAESGIGESTVRLDDYISSNSPDLTLALGDESVKNLLGSSYELAKVRCRLNQYGSHSGFIVSYHPFDLISNPRLKSLAFEDIHFCINSLL